jgi:hypothetical protein
MARPAHDLSEPLYIEMKHVARCRVLVPMCRWRWIEQAQPTHTRRSAYSSDRRHTPANTPRDLPDGHPSTSELQNPFSLTLVDLVRLPLRSGATVFEWFVRLGSSPPFS